MCTNNVTTISMLMCKKYVKITLGDNIIFTG